VHLYTVPQDVGLGFWCQIGAIGHFWLYRSWPMQDLVY
jgi:hypothetical protein